MIRFEKWVEKEEVLRGMEDWRSNYSMLGVGAPLCGAQIPSFLPHIFCTIYTLSIRPTIMYVEEGA